MAKKRCPVKKEDLPQALRVDAKVKKLVQKYYWHHLPPKLYFGFGLNYEDCVDYYLRSVDIPSIPTEKGPTGCLAVLLSFHVAKHLSDICDHYFEITIPQSADYQLLLSLYSNHDIDFRELADHEEEDVIELLRKELPAFLNQEPQWLYPFIDE